jgi:DNA invertase Pin-like site-specific DNA recombinase
MDVTKILAELREERERIEEAIMSLERLARGRGRRRGRPPSWLQEIRKKGRPPGAKKTAAPAKTAVA